MTNVNDAIKSNLKGTVSHDCYDYIWLKHSTWALSFLRRYWIKSLAFTCPHSQQRPRSRHHVFANIFEKIKKFEKPFCLCSYWAQEEFDDKKGSKSHDIVPLKRWHRTKNILFAKKKHFIQVNICSLLKICIQKKYYNILEKCLLYKNFVFVLRDFCVTGFLLLLKHSSSKFACQCSQRNFILLSLL